MPVDFKHPDYSTYSKFWFKCRDAWDGEEAVKNRGLEYLPQLSGQSDQEYDAYRSRALFYGATARTIQGLTGMIVRKEPEIVATNALKKALTSFGYNGEAFLPFAQQAISEVLGVGRVGVLVDMPVTPTGSKSLPPYCVIYRAENIVNWRVSMIAGVRRLSMVVLLENAEVPDAGDPFTVKQIMRYRVLTLVKVGEADTDESWEYQQELYEKRQVGSGKDAKDEWVKTQTIVPQRIGGKRLNVIPFTFINPGTTSERCELPPLLALVNVNLSHYRTSADLEHGRHFTALPTVWAAGFDTKSVYRIGSSIAWVAEDTTAKAQYLEFTGKGLGHLAEALTSKEGLMAILGARLLEERQADAEAASAIRLRQHGEKSALASISTQVSEAFTKVLQWFEWFMAGGDSKATIAFNEDFDTAKLDPQLLTALLAAVQSGTMSWDSFFFNAKKGELYPDGRTAEEELELINASPLMGAGVGPLAASKNSAKTQEEDEDEEDPEEEDDEGDDEEPDVIEDDVEE